MTLQIWFYAMASVLIVSAASLAGILTLVLNPKRQKRIVLFLVSFAVGGLFGDAFIHILPESFEELGSGLSTSLLIVAGIFIFFLLEKILRWRHCHVVGAEEEHIHPVALINLVGDVVHNFIDGMIIGVSYTVSIPLGITTSLAVFLHEIPQEMGDFGVLLHSGLSWRKALLLNFLSALAAVAGVVIALTLGSAVEGFSLALLPITAGGFIYIAGADLIPELHHHSDVKTSLIQMFMIGLGITAMALLTLVEV